MFAPKQHSSSWYFLAVAGAALAVVLFVSQSKEPLPGTVSSPPSTTPPTARKQPWEGVDVVINEDANDVRRVLITNGAAGFTPEMLMYCGKSARVVRFDATDKKDGVLRAVHADGTVFTWPLEALSLGDDSSSSIDKNHPLGVKAGDMLFILRSAADIQALCRDSISIGWSDAMAQYCGQEAAVQRYDLTDKLTGTVRLLQKDGTAHTWPLRATVVCKKDCFHFRSFGVTKTNKKKNIVSFGAVIGGNHARCRCRVVASTGAIPESDARRHHRRGTGIDLRLYWRRM